MTANADAERKTATPRARRGLRPSASFTILCLLAQVRILEGLGEPREVLEAAFRRIAEDTDQGAARIFAQQLVSALIERISRMR